MGIFEETTSISDDGAVEALGRIMGQLALIANEYRGVIGDTATTFIHDVENYDMGDPRRRGSVMVLQYVKFPSVQDESPNGQIELEDGSMVNRDIQGFVRRIVGDHHNYTLSETDTSMVNFDIAKQGIVDPAGNVVIYPDSDIFVRAHELSQVSARVTDSPEISDFADLKSDDLLSQETYSQNWDKSLSIMVVITINRRDRLVELTHIAEMFNEQA